ncbi:PPOX class probable F420-dependent enzyme [Diaminobutyricimonas aerilata]|uniref:PPOX class probable F420-dependent enzyme n=1 Tax=Diaminobutyricimonas aerilata TaxID=1162967 RepID=A0A2M9CFN8_9MICO|nr:TIGR03618 family F420-dependent PPOX class oxidoreductase [Diaminobutyricimonas aerilata]PJJ70699.1 PPOX class probable F420-dependent enzyme [Diaminobutyricimonas aerilata]
MTRSWNDVRAYFERGAIAHVATLMPDGSPHSVPVWVAVEGDELAFFSIADSRKDKNLSADPRVAVSTTNPENALDMAFVRGTVTTRLTGEEAMPIVDRIAELYTGGPYDIRSGLAAFLVTPEVAWANDYRSE